MLKVHLRPWIFRARSRPQVNFRSFTLIYTSNVTAHGRRSDREAPTLTDPSMPTLKRKNPHLHHSNKFRKLGSPAPREDKMDDTKIVRMPLSTVELTPVETTIKRLLLDVKSYIERKEKLSHSATQEEMVLRFTGGWVRDKLLGVSSHDIDVAISTMTGFQFATYLHEYLNNPTVASKYANDPTLLSGADEFKLHKIKANPEKSKHLETVTTRLFGLDIDLVNLRKETYSEDSRNPQMEFGTAEEDALRRDATVNAIFYNLNTSTLEDLTGLGMDDMERKLIRTPLEPYQTFKDDPLRVLRLIRFASRLGYHIDEESQKAMQNDDIKDALKVKISKERVGIEVTKMLQGPDPGVGLKYIDDLGLYSTIFANQQDGVEPLAASWALAYDALDGLLNSVSKVDEPQYIKHLSEILIRDENERFHAWVIAAFVPWADVPTREPRSKKEKPPPMARAAEVARDNLRMENRVLDFLKDAATFFQQASSLKTSVVLKDIPGTPAEARLHVGLSIRSWKSDWRLIVIMAMLQEIVAGGEVSKVFQEFDLFLSYIEKENLLDVTEMKPIANGNEVSAAFGAPKGRWLATALEMLINWQLLHPGSTDKDQALEMLKSRRAELGV